MTQLRDPIEVIREEQAMHAPILSAVADGALTIPEIAERIGAPNHEAVYWVMGMRRYGFLLEEPDADDEGYFRYAATGREV